MANNKTLGIAIAVAVAILMGVILVNIIAEQTNVLTQTYSVAGEAQALSTGAYPNINASTVYTVTNNPTGWKTTDCPLTNFAIKNSTGVALTLTDDYTVTLSTGKYSLLNTVNTNTTAGLYPGNYTYVTYTYCKDNYISQGWQRTVLNMVPGFFALAILLGAAFVIFYILKEEGIDLGTN